MIVPGIPVCNNLSISLPLPSPAFYVICTNKLLIITGLFIRGALLQKMFSLCMFRESSAGMENKFHILKVLRQYIICYREWVHKFFSLQHPNNIAGIYNIETEKTY